MELPNLDSHLDVKNNIEHGGSVVREVGERIPGRKTLCEFLWKIMIFTR